ncbi:MAG TPA: methyltransferase domain-containing protein [Solirubrobacteraceae bacterium]|nr:methyltransferase domain-containing protein [Solirubrobacteraceae bacterium]
MSASEPAAAGAQPGHTAGWRTPALASSYLDTRETLLPKLEVMEDVLRRLLLRAPRPTRRFLDLGCGGGAMSALVRSLAPAEGVLVDFSEPMLERARARLGEGSGAAVLAADLSDPAWLRALAPGRYDLVVSGLAIHHLTAERKRALYAEVHGLLEPRGMFVNMDYVTIRGPLQGLWDEEILANAIRAERRRGGTRSEAEIERDTFDDSAEDRPDSVEDQLAWLREAGFEQVELHFKWAEAAVFGGIKPEQGDERWSR